MQKSVANTSTHAPVPLCDPYTVYKFMATLQSCTKIKISAIDFF